MRGHRVPGHQAFARRAPLILGLLCLGPFVGVLDTTIIAIALPSIRDGLDFPSATSQWVLTGYSLTFGGFLVTAGRAGDLVGRRKILVAGLYIFVVASLIGGLAVSWWQLVAGRLLQGVGAAALIPSSLSMLTATYRETTERNRAIAIYGAMTGVGFVAAMLMGGVLTDVFGWRAVLLINLPLLVPALVAPRILIESRHEDAVGADLIGSCTLTAGLGACIVGSSQLHRAESRSAMILVLALGVALLVGFLRHERRFEHPLLPLSMIGQRGAVSAYSVAMLRAIFGIGTIYVLMLYFQDVRLISPLHTGLFFLPMALTSVAVAPLAGRLSTRSGIRKTLSGGLITLLLGAAVLVTMPTTGALPIIVIGMVVVEIGFMISEVPTTIAGASSLGSDNAGLAAGLLGTGTELGHAVGIGVIATIVELTTRGPDPGAVVAGLRWGYAVAIASAAVALIATLKWLPADVDRGTTSEAAVAG